MRLAHQHAPLTLRLSGVRLQPITRPMRRRVRQRNVHRLTVPCVRLRKALSRNPALLAMLRGRRDRRRPLLTKADPHTPPTRDNHYLQSAIMLKLYHAEPAANSLKAQISLKGTTTRSRKTVGC